MASVVPRFRLVLRDAIAGDEPVPSVYACYRFTAKLRAYAPMLERCIATVLASLRATMPAMGHDVAIDASDLPAFTNGQRFVSKGGRERAPEEYVDPDASWGHRSLSQPARAAASTATASTPPCAPTPAYPSRGMSRLPPPTNRRLPRH